MRLAMLTAFAIASLAGAGVPAAQEQSVVVGCLEKVDDGFSLRATPAASRRTGGSMTAKASTPIRGGSALAPQRSTGGSNSPKASTPIRAVATSSSGRRAGAVMTAKGSVPIATAEIAYEVQGDPNQLAGYVDAIVEIRGTTIAAQRLKVDQIRVLSSSCSGSDTR